MQSRRKAFAGGRREIDRGGDAIIERGAIRQIRERIVMRHVLDALLVMLAFGEIVDDADEILRLSVSVRGPAAVSP